MWVTREHEKLRQMRKYLKYMRRSLNGGKKTLSPATTARVLPESAILIMISSVVIKMARYGYLWHFPCNHWCRHKELKFVKSRLFVTFHLPSAVNWVNTPDTLARGNWKRGLWKLVIKFRKVVKPYNHCQSYCHYKNKRIISCCWVFAICWNDSGWWG